MYIAPQSLLNLLHNIPLDTTYEHTLYFANASAQYAYFLANAKYRAVDFSYIRPNDGTIRVNYKADDLYDVNYIMFQNTAFGNKWFYAYVKAIRYVSNQTSEIDFEIDDVQTWLFDFEPDYCFVERTHTQTDVIGEHIEPEGLDCGEYIFNSYSEIAKFSKLCVLVGICSTTEGANGALIDGMYSGANLVAFNPTDVDGINSLINDYRQSPDSVTVMYMCPTQLLYSDARWPSAGGEVVNANAAYKQTISCPNGILNGTEFLGNYQPKNKKLYTYPYCFYHIDNGNGSELSLRYEFFPTSVGVRVQIGGTMLQPVQVILNPVQYKTWPFVSFDIAKTESLTLSSYPMCSWNMDSYKAWVAQNSVPIGVQTAMSGVNTVGQLLNLNFGGAATTALNTAADLYVQNYRASIAADLCKGSQSSGNVNAAIEEMGFYGGMVSITPQYARSIDDFFTKFGYAVKRLMKPIYNARPHWTYIKTVGCTLTGSIPCDAMNNICSIFDKGITFWMNGTEVGNYSLNNQPGGGNG